MTLKCSPYQLVISLQASPPASTVISTKKLHVCRRSMTRVLFGMMVTNKDSLLYSHFTDPSKLGPYWKLIKIKWWRVNSLPKSKVKLTSRYIQDSNTCSISRKHTVSSWGSYQNESSSSHSKNDLGTSCNMARSIRIDPILGPQTSHTLEEEGRCFGGWPC